MTVRFGESFQLELYGTSHGPCIGLRVEGLPAGKRIDTDRLQAFLDRRAPGRNAWSTSRKEADRPIFRSGVKPLAGPDTKNREAEERPASPYLVTTGEPLVAEILNTNTRPQDYRHAATDKASGEMDHSPLIPRPAHADYPAWVRYGKIESGGGPFSARLTAALCIAGGIFLQWLEEEGVTIAAHIASIGDISDLAMDGVSPGIPHVDGDFPVIDREKGEEMKALIAEVKEAGDSIGGSIECKVCGLPPGIGTPLFGSIESRICQALFAVPAVKGVEFGAGFAVSEMKGSDNNDPFLIARSEVCPDGEVRTSTNHHGGILGGLSSGMPILFRTAMKPTPSIAIPQRSVDLRTMTETTFQVKGRHDPCIVPRAVPCIEAAAAIAVMDLVLEPR